VHVINKIINYLKSALLQEIKVDYNYNCQCKRKSHESHRKADGNASVFRKNITKRERIFFYLEILQSGLLV
jgi:hypothetical protein